MGTNKLIAQRADAGSAATEIQQLEKFSIASNTSALQQNARNYALLPVALSTGLAIACSRRATIERGGPLCGKGGQATDSPVPDSIATFCSASDEELAFRKPGDLRRVDRIAMGLPHDA